MKCVVLYKSISGFTKKYAEWISEELKAELFPINKFKKKDLNIYDVIIFGGSLHAVGINGISFIKKNFELLRAKKVIVFATGASPNQSGIPSKIIDKNFSEEQKQHIRFYYFRGGFNYKRLNMVNKILMTLLRLKITTKKEEKRVPDEKSMLAAFKRPVDFTKRENITVLIQAAKEMI